VSHFADGDRFDFSQWVEAIGLPTDIVTSFQEAAVDSKEALLLLQENEIDEIPGMEALKVGHKLKFKQALRALQKQDREKTRTRPGKTRTRPEKTRTRTTGKTRTRTRKK
jgi:hypothetical protein